MFQQNPRRRHHGAADVNESQEMGTLPTEDTPSSETESHTLEARPSRGEETDRQLSSLRIIKWIALVFIGLCICTGAVLSKVTLVSITGRMFYLTRDRDGNTLPRSILFIQLTLMLIIPEAVSFVTCLVRGVVGKTTNSFPWPNTQALILVSHVSIRFTCYPAQCIILWVLVSIHSKWWTLVIIPLLQS